MQATFPLLSPPHQVLLLLLLLSRFSRVRLRATPETAAHQAPPSLGFSRQERWSGLPFPSPPPDTGQVLMQFLTKHLHLPFDVPTITQ